MPAKKVEISATGEWTTQEIERTISAAQHDKSLVPLAVEMLTKHPEAMHQLSDVVKHTRQQLLETSFRGNELVILTYMARVEDVEKKLIGNSTSRLERMLCERIATCWLAVELAERTASQQTNLAIAAFWDKRLTLAHKRYTQAIVDLARVRRLRIPMQQINIAQPGAQQMNLAIAAEPQQPAKAVAGATE